MTKYSLRKVAADKHRAVSGYRRVRPTAAGFTLIEIILVVVVISVLAGVAVPHFSRSFKNLLVQTTVNQLASVMRYAQGRSIAQRAVIRLIFKENLNAYQLQQATDTSDPLNAEEAFEPLPNRWGRWFLIPVGVEAEATRRTIEFYPDGRIQKARVILCHEQRCLTVSSRDQRGRVLIFDGRLEEEGE